MKCIKEMIKELCPEGVEYVKLGVVCGVLRGDRVTKGQILTQGMYPVISGGITPMGYLNESNRKANTITVSQYGTAGYVDFQYEDFWANDICYCLYPSELLNNRFLWYSLKAKQEYLYSIRNTNATPYSLPLGTLKAVLIPLPPLPIQQKIADTLDKFTSLISNIDKEIDLRQKQYEYYREKLLTFSKDDESVEWKKLGEMCEFKNGLNKDKDSFGHGTPIINYTDVYNNSGIKRDIVKGAVELNEKEIKRFLCKKGDVFFTRTSETREEVGYASVLLDDIENCSFSGFLIRARQNEVRLLPEYCKYCFSTYNVRQQIIANSSLTTRATITGGSLGKITIPIPPMTRQEEIVSTLDKFEAMIANLKRERELRQKQYEYYREKLLTFK